MRRDFTLPADSLLPGSCPPRRKMLCGRKFGHVGSGLGDHDVGSESTDAGDGADQIPEAAKGLHHHLDPLGECLDGAVCWSIKFRCMRPKRVMSGEPTVEGFGQLRDFSAQLLLGQSAINAVSFPPVRTTRSGDADWPRSSCAENPAADRSPLRSVHRSSRVFGRMHLNLIDQHTAAIEALTERIEVVMQPFRGFRDLICTIPGIGGFTADVVVAETGADMTKFPTAQHLASWRARPRQQRISRQGEIATHTAGTPTSKEHWVPRRCRSRTPATPTWRPVSPVAAAAPSAGQRRRATRTASRDLEHRHHQHRLPRSWRDYFTRLNPRKRDTTLFANSKPWLPRHPRPSVLTAHLPNAPHVNLLVRSKCDKNAFADPAPDHVPSSRCDPSIRFTTTPNPRVCLINGVSGVFG
ncbi:transposase IS116/IS110/IS902 family protein [Mycobacterium ulcerans str. Harvey]|uniref:Transposase IS116/IS110/IS902 family protein n=1 Tax=Mycobacterium ulcerans str. Harvey TaxID=1299332 RepID=A0ABN0QL42_MYCUL|nr:transposase IS116/IS110/IS902 family protein [Mycobacterium ulcerans str. Harvey]